MSKVMEERPYQQELVSDILPKLNPEHNIMLQLPTGAGKTHIAIEIANKWIGDLPLIRNITWMTHRKELERQSYNRLVDAGLNYAVVSSQRRLYNAISRGDHVPTQDTLLVVDESHHSTAKTWRRVIELWPGPVLGLTATPWRLSKKEGFSTLFHELIIGPTTLELIKLGYLVPCRVRHPVGEVGKGVGWNNGDFSMGQTWEQGNKTTLIEEGVDWLLRERKKDSRTLCYCTTVQHAESVFEYATLEGLRSGLILGKTPAVERERTYKEFENHELDLLVNVEVATEGCDLPEVDSILMQRPTQSLALYLQMVGRAMRPAPNKKYALILDAFANWERHGLPEEEREWTLEARKSKKRGVAPTRLCRNCNTVNHIAARSCFACGMEFGSLCEKCGNFVYGLMEGEQCPRCSKEAQKRMFAGGVRTVVPAIPEYIHQKKKYGVFVEGDEPEIGSTVLVKDGAGNRWKESIIRVVNKIRNGFVCETKSV